MPTVEIAGLQDLLQKMSQLQNIDPKEAQDVLLKGTQVFLAEAKATAPPDVTGNLRKSLKAKRGNRSRTYAMAFMAVDRKIAPHPHLVEEGHQIVVGGKLGKGGRVKGKVKAHPFFWPAVQNKVADVQLLVLEGLQRVIEEAAK